MNVRNKQKRNKNNFVRKEESAEKKLNKQGKNKREKNVKNAKKEKQKTKTNLNEKLTKENSEFKFCIYLYVQVIFLCICQFSLNS